MRTYKKKELINFENDITKCFNDGKIRTPAHLFLTDNCLAFYLLVNYISFYEITICSFLL